MAHYQSCYNLSHVDVKSTVLRREEDQTKRRHPNNIKRIEFYLNAPLGNRPLPYGDANQAEHLIERQCTII